MAHFAAGKPRARAWRPLNVQLFSSAHTCCLFFSVQDQNWTVQQLRDQRYDAVFHLVTTAIGAENFYTQANNATRREDQKLARELDLKILSAWVGHPKVFIIDNSTDLDWFPSHFWSFAWW